MSRWENLIQMMRHIEDAQDGISTDKTHYFVLYALARMCKPEVAVEIGSRRGGSAMWLCRALEENGSGHLTCIDPFVAAHGGAPGFLSHFHANLERLGLHHRYSLIKEYSGECLEQVPTEIDFLYIDGDHSVKGCTEDIVNYVPRVKSQGVVAIHDSRGIPEVKEAIAGQKGSTLAPYFDFEVENYQGMWVGIKI